MTGTITIDFCRYCGFGRVPGDPPRLALGWVKFGWIKGGIEARFRDLADALKTARDSLRGGK